MRDLAGVQGPKGGQGLQGLRRAKGGGQGHPGVLEKGGQGRQGVLQKGGQRRLGVLQKGGQGRLEVLEKGRSDVARSWRICVFSKLSSYSGYQASVLYSVPLLKFTENIFQDL